MNPSDDLPFEGRLNEVPSDDQALGELLGASLRDHVEAPSERPKTAEVFELAARTQRRQRLAGVAAAAVLLVGAGFAWTQLDDPKTESLIADQPEPTQQATPAPTTPSATTVPSASTEPVTSPTSPPVPDSTQDNTPDPADYSDGPAPQWQEVTAPFSGEVVDQLVSLNDGRVAAFTSLLADSADQQLWLSVDGLQWTPTATFGADVYVEDIAAVGETLYVVGVRREPAEFNDHVGWSVLSEIEVLLLTSSDQGQTWDEEVLPTDGLGDRTEASEFSEVIHIGSSIEAANGNVVVTVASNAELSLEQLITESGLVPEGIEWLGVDYGPEEVVAYFTDPTDPSGDVVELPFTAEELGVDLTILEPAMSAQLVAWKVQPDGPVEEVHRVDGWASLSADGARFYLSGYDEVTATSWWSDDGEIWNSLAEENTSGVGQVAGYDQRLYRVSWGEGTQLVEVSTDGGQTWALVRDFEQISIAGIEVGGAGLASVAFASPTSFGDVDLSPVVISKEGYTLTVNYDPQSAVLIDDSTGEAVLSFTEEQMTSDEDSPGVELNEFTGDLTFSDPTTGEVYIVVTDQEFQQSGEASSSSSVDVMTGIPDQWIGWSADGTTWSWEALSDVLDVGPGAFATTAVTDTTVVMVVSTFGVAEPGSDSPSPGQTLVFVGEVPQ